MTTMLVAKVKRRGTAADGATNRSTITTSLRGAQVIMSRSSCALRLSDPFETYGEVRCRRG
jgi:hypothetical protein